MKKHICPILIILLLTLLSSCYSNQNAQIDLSDGWFFSLSGFDSEFEKLDSDHLPTLESIIPGGKGYIYLKHYFELPSSLQNEELSIYLGRITMADRVWLNGSYIGGEGRFPPNEWSEWAKARLYPIPDSALNRNGQNVLTVQIWVGGEGSIVSNPFVGTKDDAKNAASIENMWNADINLIFAFLMLVISGYHFLLYFKMRESKESFYFALLNLISAIYLSVFYISEIPSFPPIWLSFEWFQKVFSSGMPFVLAFLVASFVNAFLKRKDKIHVLVIRILLLVVPFIIILCMPDYQTLRNTKSYLQPLTILPVILSLYQIIKSIINKDKEAVILMWGFSPLALAVVLDIILHEGCKLYYLPYFTSMGWQILTISLLFVLAGRFADASNEAKELNANLETKVEERTQELSEANKKLSLAGIRAEKDMKLAVHVQQSFLHAKIIPTSGWDIAYVYRPMSGVSGDLYDFYNHDNHLSGVGLFDVSGHGIASGLVTMLSKNIIQRNFDEGYNETLYSIMGNISKQIAIEKGDIENYLTGLLLRLNGNQVEYVNAGHPAILHRSGLGGKVSIVKNNDIQCGGIIGMPEMNTEYKTLRFSMKAGDSLLLFTDGLYESRDKNDNEYGVERVSATFSVSGNGSAKDKLDYILSRFERFTEGVQINDDITVIVLQRTK